MPKKVPAGERRSIQLLMRLTSDDIEVLEAASHLRQMTPNAYAHELLSSHIAVLRNDEYVQRDILNRRAFAQASGTVEQLAEHPGRAAALESHDSDAVDSSDGAV